MRDQELDRLFDRFRRKGDLQALGAVFDATAPELLRVAMSLVRDPAEADDLLQETFLTAIQRAQRFDAERRLVPWLLGILVHHAKEGRRQRLRPLDPTRLVPRAEITPELESHGRELEAELERAMSELDARERSVLEAYLRHGKGAAEIASEIGAAPGAVRMQIHRGLDRLRKALPAGLALGAAGAANAQGLAGVRGAVLRAGESAAETLAPGAGSALGAGMAGMLMANKLAVVGAVVALVAGMFLLRSLGGERESLQEGGAVARAEAPPPPSQAGAGLATPALPAATAARGSSPAARVAAQPTVDPDRAGLRGRVLEPDGRPAAGLEVALLQIDEHELFPAPLATLATSGELQVLRASTRTDEDGRFLLAGASVGSLSALGVDLGGKRATLRMLDAHLEPGATADLGDVVLAPALAVRGRIVDERGEPVAVARVRIGCLPEAVVRFGLAHLTAGGAVFQVQRDGQIVSAFELPGWLSAFEPRLPLATTITGADGHFELACTTEGRLAMIVDAPGFARLVAPLNGDLSAGLGDVSIERGQVVNGRVLDASGQPVAGVEVRAGLLTGDRELNVFAPAVRSDGEGRFRVERLPSGWQIGLAARRDSTTRWTPGRVGSGEALVQLPVEQELVLEVVDGAGNPVAAPEFFVRPAGAEALGVFGPRFVARAAQARADSPGSFELGRFASGRYLVAARAAGFAPRSLEVVLGPDGPPGQRLALAPSHPIEVHVLDAATRAPISGASVRAQENEGQPPLTLASACTDADGQATLALPASADRASAPLWLHVAHPRHAPARHVLDASASQEVVLGAGARLRVRVADRELARERHMLLLEYRGVSPAFEFHLPRLVALPSDGELELAHLPAGSWRWTLQRSLLSGEALAFLDNENEPEELGRGKVDLIEGETFELVLGGTNEGAAGGDSVLTGTVLFEGRPWESLRVDLLPFGGRGRPYNARGTNGSFRLEGLAPGGYFLVVTPGEEEFEGQAFDDQVMVHPGQALSVSYDSGAHRVDLRVVGADGVPVEDASVQFLRTDGGAGVPYVRSTNAEGRVSFTQPRSGRHQVLAVHPGGVGRMEVALVEGPGEEHELRLTPTVECAGTVRVEPGLLARPPSFSVRDERGRDYESTLELAGNAGPFRVLGLVPGPYTAWLHDGQTYLYLSLEVPEGGTGALELHFTAADRFETEEEAAGD